MEKNVLIAFGSPSDTEKFKLDKIPRNDDTQYYLSVASAHRTPDTVDEHAEDMHWDAVIAGAGMCNALKDSYLKGSPGALLVALPMRDSRTSGLSSFLSSTEMPPGYPVAAARMEDLNAALDFVNHVVSREFSGVDIFVEDVKSALIAEDAEKMLKQLGVDSYNFPSGFNTRDDRVNILFYTRRSSIAGTRAPFVCTYALPLHLIEGDGTPDVFDVERLGAYFANAQKYPNCLHTGVADGGNLGLYAAKIIAKDDRDVAARIQGHLDKGREKYKGFENVRKI